MRACTPRPAADPCSDLWENTLPKRFRQSGRLSVRALSDFSRPAREQTYPGAPQVCEITGKNPLPVAGLAMVGVAEVMASATPSGLRHTMRSRVTGIGLYGAPGGRRGESVLHRNQRRLPREHRRRMPAPARPAATRLGRGTHRDSVSAGCRTGSSGSCTASSYEPLQLQRRAGRRHRAEQFGWSYSDYGSVISAGL